MESPQIATVELAVLKGKRPRSAGSNARLGAHGIDVRVPLLRVTATDGSSGFGACHATWDEIVRLLGTPLDELWAADVGVVELWRPFDYPIWDLMAKRAGLPVYALAAKMAGVEAKEPFGVRCYDTSLYFDDLHIADDATAADLIAAEASEGYARGHRAFKIKVGRGARHLPLEQGTRRDIAIVRAVRAAVGAHAPIMLDANNGYNLNLTKRVLAETADCDIFWIEEPFYEDNVLYEDLRAWLGHERLSTLIADGEGQADPRLLAWARAGLVDVIQYDIFSYGMTRWLALGQVLDAQGIRSAPHHYGGHYGNYVACHLGSAIRHFAHVEWDEATTPGLDTSGYTIREGQVAVPSLPGFGLVIDEGPFQAAARVMHYTP